MQTASHTKAVERIIPILQGAGYTIRREYDLPVLMTDEGERSYTLDIYCERRIEKGWEKLAIECDGDSHLSKGRARKDKLRDQLIKTVLGIRTIRFKTEDVNGCMIRKLNGTRVHFELSDETIREEIGITW